MDSIIGILTDFGEQDIYVSSMKAVILSINPCTRIVDISHDIPRGDIETASFEIENIFSLFPEGTIFLAIVDPGVGSERKGIIVVSGGYTLVGPDNGIFSSFSRKGNSFVEINKSQYFRKPVSNTFHGRDIFAPVAAHLSLGKKPSSFGTLINHITVLERKEPTVTEKGLNGSIIHIDRFGNLISNIKLSVFSDYTQSTPFEICFKKYTIKKTHSTYGEGGTSPIALFGSNGYLEISVKDGNAKETLHAKKGDTIIIKKVKKVESGGKNV
jgi:S-adenosylmethionine hydrolase